MLVHGTLGRSHTTVQRSHPHTFYVAKVHCICYGLVIHTLHGLEKNIYKYKRGFMTKINFFGNQYLWTVKMNEKLLVNSIEKKTYLFNLSFH